LRKKGQEISEKGCIKSMEIKKKLPEGPAVHTIKIFS